MPFYSFSQVLILALVWLSFVFINKGIHYLFYQIKYTQFGTIYFDFYAIMQCESFDINQQLCIVLLFDWRIALLLWILSFFSNAFLFQHDKFLNLICHAETYDKMVTRFDQKYPSKANQKCINLCSETPSIKPADIKYTRFMGKYLKNSYYRYSWIWAHGSVPAFLLLKELAIGLIYGSTSAFPHNYAIEYWISAIVGLIGFIWIVYWIGYFFYPWPFRFKNWRKSYHILFLLITLLILAFILLIAA